MAEVEKVKLPGVGKVDKKLVYIAGAGIAGFVGYAWISRGGMQPEPEQVLVPAPVTDYEPPTVTNSNGSFGPAPAPGVPGMPVSNVEWHTMARDQADALRFNEATAETALQKYLAKQDLTAGEMSVILAVTAIIGTPPQNGPFPIRLGLPNPNPPGGGGGHQGETLPAPAGFRAEGIDPYVVMLSWHRVAGAVTYEIRADSGRWHNMGSVERVPIPGAQDHSVHQYSVRAIDGSGKPGAIATASGRTITQAEVNQNLVNLTK